MPQLVLGALQSLRVPKRLMLAVAVDRDGRRVLFGHFDSRRLRRSGRGRGRFGDDHLRRMILRRRFLVSIGFDRRRRRQVMV